MLSVYASYFLARLAPKQVVWKKPHCVYEDSAAQFQVLPWRRSCRQTWGAEGEIADWLKYAKPQEQRFLWASQCSTFGVIKFQGSWYLSCICLPSGVCRFRFALLPYFPCVSLSADFLSGVCGMPKLNLQISAAKGKWLGVFPTSPPLPRYTWNPSPCLGQTCSAV